MKLRLPKLNRRSESKNNNVYAPLHPTPNGILRNGTGASPVPNSSDRKKRKVSFSLQRLSSKSLGSPREPSHPDLSTNLAREPPPVSQYFVGASQEHSPSRSKTKGLRQTQSSPHEDSRDQRDSGQMSYHHHSPCVRSGRGNNDNTEGYRCTEPSARRKRENYRKMGSSETDDTCDTSQDSFELTKRRLSDLPNEAIESGHGKWESNGTIDTVESSEDYNERPRRRLSALLDEKIAAKVKRRSEQGADEVNIIYV